MVVDSLPRAIYHSGGNGSEEYRFMFHVSVLAR